MIARCGCSRSRRRGSPSVSASRYDRAAWPMVAESASHPFDLARFVDAQRDMYSAVVAELRAGRKQGHWIWFIFPQLAGLGRSAISERYAISGLDEARAYLAHPVLGSRLRECAGLLLGAPANRSADAILGGID